MSDRKGIVQSASLGIAGLCEGTARIFDLWGHSDTGDTDIQPEQRSVLLAEWETTASDLRRAVRRCLSA